MGISAGNIQHTFRAFRHRNYALFFTGQGISQIGTWMQRTAVSWVIYSMTHSAFMLGLTVFSSQFPSFIFSLYGGIVSDRYNRYKIMLLTQFASMVQAVLLAILAYTKYYAVWEILVLSVILGIINAFDVPARQPLVHEMIPDKADLTNALALNSSLNNLARLAGPALSGFVLVKFGAGICFILNAVSFVAVIASLLLMKLPPYKATQTKNKPGTELTEGFRYLRNTPAIGILILMLTVVSLFVLPYNTLLPVFAKIVFKGDASTFGLINSFIGLGAVLCTFFLASLKPGRDLKILLLINTVLLGIGLMFFSVTKNFPLAMVFATITGFGSVCITTTCMTMVQMETTPSMRGRMISYIALGYFGMLPLGSLLIGIISQRAGATETLFGEGIVALIIAALFSKFLRKDNANREEIDKIKELDEMVLEKM